MADFRMNQALPPVVKNLIIFNGLVFLALKIFGGGGFDSEINPFNPINNLFALHDIRSDYFQPHQLVTHLFLHGSFPHILFNMLALWMFGSVLENVWGGKRFLTFYMLCGLGAAVLHLGVLYMELTEKVTLLQQYGNQLNPEQIGYLKDMINGPTVGASGAVFGCLAAFGYLFPNSLIYLYFFIPMKAKWFVIIYAAIELWLGVANSAGDNVAHWAHLGGALVGFLLVLYWNKRNRRHFY